MCVSTACVRLLLFNLLTCAQEKATIDTVMHRTHTHTHEKRVRESIWGTRTVYSGQRKKMTTPFAVIHTYICSVPVHAL